MATPETFARELRSVAASVPGKLQEVARRTAVAINQTVTMATPVDTGRARANWQVSLGAPVTKALDQTDRGGSATIARNNAIIAGYRSGTIWLSNNVPYIMRLNQGHSAQAPSGFVEAAIQAGKAAVDRAEVF